MDELKEEHWKLDDNGNFEGLYLVDPSLATGVDLWEKLENVIKEYAKLHPDEMRLHLLETAQIRLEAKNEKAEAKEGLRWGCSIPPGLYFRIQTLEPLIFNDKDYFHTFLKKYPGFRICQKV